MGKETRLPPPANALSPDATHPARKRRSRPRGESAAGRVQVYLTGPALVGLVEKE
jgi:hypothetical protein